jgi:subtilase family serine protease
MRSRSHFVKLDRVNPNELHEVIFSMKHNNLDKLEELVLSRSTPGNENYLKWLTYDELGDMITNHESHDNVERILLEYNHNIGDKKIQITFKSNHKEFIKALAPIYIWERILNTKFYYFNDLHQRINNDEDIYKHRRSLEYSLPSELYDHVDVVFNTIQIPSPLNKKNNDKKIKKNEEDLIRNLIIKDSNLLRGNDNIKRSLATYEGFVDINFLKSFYGIPATKGSSTMKQAIFETNDQHWSPGDLVNFQNLNHLPKDTVLEEGDDKKTEDCHLPNIVCDEGNLDVQFIMGAAQNVRTVYWYICVSGDHTACGGGDVFLEYAVQVGNDPNPATASSISWGAPENLVDIDHIRAFDVQSLKLNALGVTTCVSSGDDGVMGAIIQSGSTIECSCNAPSGYSDLSESDKWNTTNGDWNGFGYFPSFPATSPWVVAVGGTQGPENNNPEIACSSSDGGVITTGLFYFNNLLCYFKKS